jgi:hypothetical protein
LLCKKKGQSPGFASLLCWLAAKKNPLSAEAGSKKKVKKNSFAGELGKKSQKHILFFTNGSHMQ